METNPDLIQDLNDRKYKLVSLMNNVKSNSLINETTAFNFFIHCSTVTDLYKYTGDLAILQQHLDNELSTNEHGYKAFLEGYVNEENTITVYQAILSQLS